jgi:predicted small lipoprotein YifL
MRTVIITGSLLLLAACGSKGPLILPPPPGAPQQAPARLAVPVDHSTAPGAAR